MANWRAILKWSLRQHDGTRDTPQMDEERRQWLQEALQAMAAAPTETQILQAAVAVLRAHSCGDASGEGEGTRGEVGEEEESLLVKAFEEMQYLIEDLDHANNLIPMGGVEVITSYLSHPKHSLVECACKVIATATQNNPKSQQAFLSTIPKLLKITNDRALPSSVRLKALSAVSCLTRDFPPSLLPLLSSGGLSVLREALEEEEEKILIKALFILMSYYTSAEGEVKDQLLGNLPSFVPKLVRLVKSGPSREVKGHALSTLATMATHHREAVRECVCGEEGVEETLEEAGRVFREQGEETEEELSYIKTIRDICFPN